MALSKSKPSCTDELGGKKKSLNMIIKTRKVEGTKFNLHATLLVRDRKKVYIAFAFSIYAIV